MPFHSLMFGWEYPPLHTGGLGVACQGIVRGLLHHGVRVTMVLPHGTVDSHSAEMHAGLKPDYEPTILTVQSNLQPYEGQEAFQLRMNTARTNLKLAAVEESHGDLYGPNLGEAVEDFTRQCVDKTAHLKPDIIHSHDWMTYDAGIRAATHHRVPIIAHLHATELDRTDFKPDPWIYAKERNGLIQADKVIAVSNFTKNLLVKEYGISADKITVIHNGHDKTPLVQPVSNQHSKHPLVLFLGRMTTQKNPHLFLEAAKLVREQRSDVQFVMAGDGPMLPELMHKSASLGLSDCVIFTGKASKQDVEKIFHQASCFVMPSLSEPFGLVALEAAAADVPVIMSKQSGAAEVMEHCFKVDFWDSERFADCIITVLREEPLARQLRTEASKTVSRLSWPAQSKHIYSLYKNMICV